MKLLYFTAFTILTEYPWYFVIFCLLLGLLYAWITYSKNNISKKEGHPYSWPVWMLFAMRALSTAIIAYLLLSPVVKSMFKKVEKPIIVIATDNSQSIILNKDSAYYKGKYLQDVDALSKNLSEKYDVRRFNFGAQLSDKADLTFKEKKTNLSGLYDKLYNTFYNQNIGAVITLTDGIYNEGQNPLFNVRKFNSPFYMVALGDTQPQKDFLVRDVQYNRIVYSGNIFPMQIQLRAKGYKGKSANLTISNKGKTVFTSPVNIDNDNFFKEIPARMEAVGAGLQHFHIEITHLDGEISYVNNSYDLFIDVLDSKKKILMVANAPHPDMSALKSSIERNSFYEVNQFVYNDFLKDIGINTGKLKNYQLAILDQLPGNEQNANQLISALHEADVPVLFIVGSQTTLSAFNTLETGLKIQGPGGKMNDVTGAINPNFGLFSLSEDLSKTLAQMPPVQCPFGDYKMGEKQSIALWQQVGKVKSQMPLLMFSNNGKQKTGVLCGEGIWKWFMFDFAANQNHKAIDELVDKTIQYLCVKSDNRLFRVHPGKNYFYEDEKVTFDAEVYNQSFEPIRNSLVNMSIRNEEGKEYQFTFQPRGDGYFLDAQFLPSGTYTYKASTKIGETPYTLSGEFIVKKVELEYLETVADHRLLNTLAAQQGGKMIYPKDMATLTAMLEKREDIKDVAYMQTDFLDLIHFKWLFFVLLVLLATEWYLRKHYGSY